MEDIKSVKKEYIKSVKTFEESSLETINKLRQENETLKQKVFQLEHLISFQATVTPEELVCARQIQILKNTSDQRELTLDEVKRLDLLIKNLRLIKDQSTENVSNPQYRDVTEADLVRIASGKSDEDK